MNQAVIDIGSNSMRLTAYELDGSGAFRILFREKLMVGLAGYVENGVLSDDGIRCACSGLSDFKNTVEALGIGRTSVFATASLRNIRNSAEAVNAVSRASGLEVEVISGEEEALLGYIGAMREISIESGVFADIGGASTELVRFENGNPVVTTSYGVGSLNLYRMCVKKILPNEAARKRINEELAESLTGRSLSRYGRTRDLVCVGGTARAVLKIAKRVCNLSDDAGAITRSQLMKTCDELCEGDRRSVDLILRSEPDRIHTIVPGIMILRHIVTSLDAQRLIISKYGVREGYLCQRILPQARFDSSTRETVS